MVIADRPTSTCISRVLVLALAAGAATLLSPRATGRAQDAAGDAPETTSETMADAAADPEASAPSGRIESGIDGRVLDGLSRETLIEAPVIVVGRSRRVMTDYDGNFAIDLPPGTYTLRSYYDYYEPARVENVEVRRGERTRVEIVLAPEGSLTAEEVVIEVRAEAGTAASQLRVRREEVAAVDSVSSEEMSRAPDSTASDSARRAVGVTILDDYLYVRGLGGRYVGTLLNGVVIPNTDPDFPGVQLDVFPTGLLESLTIRKTYTADMPGDWAGGLMDVATRDYPTTLTMRASLSLGVNSDVTFRSIYGYPGGGLDGFGTDDGTRHLPSLPAARVESGRSGMTEESTDALSLTFPNTWGLSYRTALPNLNASLSIGDTVDVGGHLLGFLVSGSYRYVEEPREVVVRTASTSETNPIRDDLTALAYRRRIQLGGLGTATLEIDDGDTLTLVGLFSQNATDYVARTEGISETEGGFPIRSTRMSWLQRTLAFAQLLGRHEELFGFATLGWQLNVSYGNRYQPDLRDVLYRQNARGDWVWRDVSGSGERFYSDLVDLSYGGGFDLDMPVETVTFSVGGLVRHGGRSFETRRFAWQYEQGIAPDGRLLSPQDLFGATSITSLTTLVERTRDDDSYEGWQDLAAGYALADWRIVPTLRLTAGARLEAFRQVVVSSSPFGAGATTDTPSTRRTDLDPMPAVSLAWEVTSGMFLRASYAGTVGRPQLRELAPFLFQDFTRRRNVVGNPALSRTYIHNFDLRWEWFPSAADVISFSLFGKTFESPIESVVINDQGDVTFGNIAGADNIGGELEARLNLGTITPELRWLGVGGNLTLVYSRARLTPEQQMLATSSERPLAGQAPFAINLSLGITPPDSGLSIWIYYNVLGPRLEDVGRVMLPDVYRQPQHLLDASVTWEVESHVTLRLSATNLLYQPVDLTIGDLVLQRVQPGTTISLGVGLSL